MPRKRSIEISIPHPCTQPWEAMIPNAEGRFCNHCQKTVFDLTEMTDAEIARRMDAPDAPTCARMRKSQLNRPLEYWIVSTNRTWPRLALGAMLTVAAAMPHALLGQSPIDSLPNNDSLLTTNALIKRSKEVYHLQGNIIEAETGNPYTGAWVSINKTMSIFAGENGAFAFQIPMDSIRDSITLYVDRYRPGEGIVLRKEDLPQNIIIAVGYHEMALGGAISVDRTSARRLRKTNKGGN
jgi:hypothetical protein